MGRGIRRHHGGIERCLILLAEHPDAVAYEVMSAGMRLRDLGSDTLTWSDLATLLHYPRERGPLYRVICGEYADWDHQSALLAEVIDLLALISWQLSGDRQAKQPDPYPRPGADGRQEPAGEVTDDDDAYTIEEMDALLGLTQ